MHSRRVKRITLAVVVLGISTLAVTAVVLRDHIIESWHIHRFHSESGEDKWKRAARLEAGTGTARLLVEEWYLQKVVEPDKAECKRALQKIGELGLVRAVPSVIDLLRRITPTEPESQELQSACTEALQELGEGAAEALWTELQRAVDEISRGDSSPGVARVAFHCHWLLLRMEPDGARDFYPFLATLARSEDSSVSQSAIQILERDGPKAVPALAAIFRGGGVKLRLRILSVFTRLGPQAEEAVPVLQEALKHENSLVRMMASKALRKIQGESWH